MSRTYRVYEKTYYVANGVIYTRDEYDEVFDLECKALGTRRRWGVYPPSYGWQSFDRYEPQPDKKPWYKPTKEFKKPRRRAERARAKMSVRMGRDPDPVKKSDVWDWN